MKFPHIAWICLMVGARIIVAQDSVYLSNLVMVYDAPRSNVTSSNIYNAVDVNVSYWAPTNALSMGDINTANYILYDEQVSKAGVTLDTADVVFISNSTSVGAVPRLYIEKTYETYDTSSNPDKVKVNMWVYNQDPTNAAYDIEVNEDLSGGLLVEYGTVSINSSTYTTSVFDVITITNGRKEFTWKITTIAAGSGYYLSYVAEPSGNTGRDLSKGSNTFTSSLYYNTESSLNSETKVGPLTMTICVNRRDDVSFGLLYQHGFTALAFFMALILGVALVIGGVCLYRFFTNKSSKVHHNPEHDVIVHERGTRLVYDAEKAMKGDHTIINYSDVGEEESIVGILSMKDRLRRYREIDTLDIQSTIDIDQGLEKQRNEASEQATILLIQGLKHNRDITPVTEDQALAKHRRRKGGLHKQLDDEYNNEKRKLLKKLSAKNKAKMSRVHQRQRRDKRRLVSENSHLDDKERKEVLEMMDEQHQTEQNEEAYRLKLEQDEEMENLRKEIVAKKRMGQKELQEDLLKDIQEQGQLPHEKAAWLMKENKENQKQLEMLYDEEISRQRMQLEEKLEKRRALAKLSEQTEDDNSRVLNCLAGNQLDFIEKAKKKGAVDDDEAKVLIDKATQDMINIRKKMDTDKEKQEIELQKKLSARKKQRLAELKRKQDEELDDYERRNISMQTEGPVDPLDYLNGRLKLQSKHRQELHTLNNDVDVEHAQELANLRETIATQTEEQLETLEGQLTDQLQVKGVSETAVNQLIQQHRRQMERVREEQEHNLRQKQEELQEKLQRNKAQWMQRKAQEKQEQAQLREHEEQIVNKLITGQMVMSDEERERILKEHEKQMVKLENNLTLNKLKQKRMLEEKLQQKREKQLNKLEQKHLQEEKNRKRKQENNAEESDEDSQKEKMAMLKLQFGQRMAVIQGQKLDLEEAMESVRIEMLKERATALREQENRLGEMVANLKLSKENELARIREQEKAINSLKANLMDDLNERGILDNHECQEIIGRYKQEQDELKQRLDNNQKRREKELKLRLKQKLEQREAAMAAQQEQQLQEAVSSAKNKTAAKIKRMLLIHNHMVQMEQMRNRLEREISQTLEDTRRQHDMRRMEELQNQELTFIKSLVQFGSFKKEDLTDVLNKLFPGKTDDGIAEIMEKIYDPKSTLPKGVKENIDLNASTLSKMSLSQRVELNARENAAFRASSPTSHRELPKPAKRKNKKLKPKVSDYEYDNDSFSYMESRPEPIGETRAPQHADGDYIQAHQQFNRPNQLPPIENTEEETGGKKRKKKKKLFKALAKPQEKVYYDDDDLL